MLKALILLMAFGSPALADTQTVSVGERSYRIDLADRASGAMILALHGGGGNPDQFARSSGLSRPANAAGYAVIYPAGSGRTRLLTWNALYCCGFAQRQGLDDISFLDAVIADAARRFGLDSGKVYLTGMSNGSMLAETYAGRRAGKVKAVAGVSGTMDLSRTKAAKVPLLHIHGTADTHVPYAGGQGQEGLTNTDFTPVAREIAAFVAAFGGLSQQSRVIDPRADGMRVIETDYVDSRGVQVRLLAVEGGGHAWPGGSRAGRQGGTSDITANAEILRFFALHP